MTRIGRACRLHVELAVEGVLVRLALWMSAAAGGEPLPGVHAHFAARYFELADIYDGGGLRAIARHWHRRGVEHDDQGPAPDLPPARAMDLRVPPRWTSTDARGRVAPPARPPGRRRSHAS